MKNKKLTTVKELREYLKNYSDSTPLCDACIKQVHPTKWDTTINCHFILNEEDAEDAEDMIQAMLKEAFPQKITGITIDVSRADCDDEL